MMTRDLLAAFKRKCESLHVRLNGQKECTGPTVVYQGVVVDLEKKYFRVSSAMKKKIQSFSPSSDGGEAGVAYEVAEVERLVGRLEWCSWLVSAGRQHLFYLLRDLQQARDRNTLSMSLSSEAEAEITWWSRDSVLTEGRSFKECDNSYFLKGFSEFLPQLMPFIIFVRVVWVLQSGAYSEKLLCVTLTAVVMLFQPDSDFAYFQTGLARTSRPAAALSLTSTQCYKYTKDLL